VSVVSSRPQLVSPFPGLRPFKSHEDAIFFGRHEQVGDMLQRLETCRLLTVVGASGCGKSSLVRAGLLPALHDGLLFGTGCEWKMITFRPGSNPYPELARALSKALPVPRPSDLDEWRSDIQAMLLSGDSGLIRVVNEAGLPQGSNVMVLVDQFEELFRFRSIACGEDKDTAEKQHVTCEERNTANAFVNLLLETIRRQSDPENVSGWRRSGGMTSGLAPEHPIFVVLTMRSEFLGHCDAFLGLPEAVSQSQFLTPRMTREQLKDAIVRPLQLFGATPQAALVNRILNDVGTDPDSLPLMQHALLRTWQNAKKRSEKQLESKQGVELTTADYEKAGGLLKALSLHADEAYAELEGDPVRGESYRRIAQQLFLLLCRQTGEGVVVRNPIQVTKAAAAVGVSAESIRHVAMAFCKEGRNFITFSSDEDQAELKQETLLDISHEALIRNWDTMKGWVAAEAKSVELYRWLEQTARRWKDGNAALWDTPNLECAMRWKEEEQPSTRWATRYGGDFLLAMEFLSKSQEQKAANDQQQEAKHLAKEQELHDEAERERLRARNERKRAEREKKLRKRERWYAIGLILLGVFAVLGMSWKYFDLKTAKKRSAERSEKFLKGAKEISRSADPIKDARELWNLAVALHYDINNTETARLACELLYGKNWCVPIIPSLHHEYSPTKAVLCAATLGPKESRAKIFAVSEDGQLLVWREGKPALRKDKILFTADQPSGTENEKKRASTPPAAFFSDDRKWLVIIPPDSTLVASVKPSSPGPGGSPNPQEESVSAEIWHWSSELDSYERVQQEVKLNGRNPLRTVVWNSDSTAFAVTSYSLGWTNSFCQIFKREGYTYVPIPEVSDRFTASKVVALCFDIHNRWLATASYDGGGKVELWDPVTFIHTEIATGAKPPYLLDGRPASIGSGRAENELTITIVGQPSQVLDLTTGKFRQSFSPPTRRDQKMGIIFGPERSGRRQEEIILYRRMILADSADAPRSEPICFQGTTANAEFSDDGKSVMTLSGDSLNELDTIRIWSVTLPDPPPDADNHPFTGRDAPPWLADLAELVCGLETPFSDKEKPTLDQIAESARREGRDEYRRIWQRFEPILNDERARER
jgi:hypothetical protein